MTVEPDVHQALVDYYAAFSTLDIEAILPYFHQPSVFIGPSGVFPMPTPDALAELMSRTIDDLRSRGYGRSEFVLQEIKRLGAVSALATGVAVRYKADGEELERVDLSYLMQKADNRWRIAVLILQAV